MKFIALKLTEDPDINNVPNLKSLVLQNCINLRRIHPSIAIHKELTILDLKDCKNLTSLPSKFEIECLTELNLGGCSKLTEIPEFGKNMNRVRNLDLYSTAITTLPTSIEHLTALDSLILDYCKNLERLPNAIFNLKLVSRVKLGGCSKLDRLPENLGNAESLFSLDLNGTAIRKVPSSIGRLKHLFSLRISGCKGLSSNKSRYELLPFYSMPTSPQPIDLLFSSLSQSPASSLTSLLLSYCNLTTISNDLGSLVSLKWLALDGNDFVCLPESIIRLSKLERLELNHCTSLRSLPKLPLNVECVEAAHCISLEMLPDPLKPSDSLEPILDLQNCFKLADNQSCTDRFISGIKKSLTLPLSLPPVFIKSYYYIFFPGSEIPEWFSHQNMGKEVKIKLPSHLCKNVGIAICVVCPTRNYSLTVNGKEIYIAGGGYARVPSDHLSLVYVVPRYLDEDPNKLLWEGDVNGFSQSRIKIKSRFPSTEKVKKWGFRMIYKKDIEDLDMDVLHHNFDSLSVEVEGSSDYNMAGPSGEGSSNCEEPSEYEDCDLEESSESDLDYYKNFFF